MGMDEGRVLAPANWAPRASVPGPAFPSTGPQSQPSPTLAKGSRSQALRPGLPTRVRLPCALTAVSPGGGSHSPAVRARTRRLREAHAVLRGTLPTGGSWSLSQRVALTLPHLLLWEGSRMKSSPGPVPPDPLIRTTWAGPPHPLTVPEGPHLSPGRADAQNLGTFRISTCWCQTGEGSGSPARGFPGPRQAAG